MTNVCGRKCRLGSARALDKYKVVFTGPVGAGKSAAVRSVVGARSLQTERPQRVAEGDVTQKATTTVAMDYGAVTLDKQNRIHLYGTPGHERFDFMWDILLESCDGIILLLNNSSPDPLRDLRFYARAFARYLPHKPCVIGVTHVDVPGGYTTLDVFREAVEALGIHAEVFVVDTRRKTDVLLLIQQIIDQTVAVIASTLQPLPVPTRPLLPAVVEPLEVAIPSVPVSTAPEKPEERPIINDTLLNVLDQVGAVPGVSGLTLTNPCGEALYSTIPDEQLNEFIAFLTGLAPALENTLAMGKVNRIMLKHTQTHNLSLFIESEKTLGVVSRPKASQRGISQQVEKLLQWY